MTAKDLQGSDMSNVEYGPHCPKSTEEGGGRKLVPFKVSGSANQPQLNLKNDPSSDAMRRIRTMKFPQNGLWSSSIESARQRVK